MSLSARITLLLAAVLAVGAFLSDRLHRATFEHHFGAAERREAEGSARLVQRAIEELASDLARDATHLAWSPALHEALGREDGDVGELGGELLAPATLSASGLDVIAVLSIDGGVRFLRVSHPDWPEVTSLRALPGSEVNFAQLFGKDLESPRTAHERGPLAAGLVATEHGPLLIAARNVVSGAATSQRNGIVVAGRFLGGALGRDLEQRLGFDVDVWPVGSPSLPPDVAAREELATASPEPVVVAADEHRLDVLSTLDDVRRRPELLVRTSVERDLSAAADVALQSGLLTSLTLALGLLLALIGALRVLVLRPIDALTRSAVRIGEQEDYSVRVSGGRRDELGVLAQEFDRMLERLEEARRQVIETARAAGMSEIAMGILHNVGNVLNSVNISTSLLSERVQGMCVDDLSQLAEVMRQKADDLATFLTQDPQGRHLQPFLSALVDRLSSDRDQIALEIEALSSGLEHVCELVKSQQGLARSTQVTERVAVERLVADAVRMTAGARTGHAVTVDVELEADLPMLVLDRNKALEVLVNLLQNARQSIDEHGPRPEGHRLVVRGHRSFGGRLRIEVRDTGVGIDQELLTRIFQLGFTTKSKGSGLGLHTAANGAQALGGSLSAESVGRGHGATFVLELPFTTRNEQEVAA